LEEIASLISILNSLMDEQQSSSRHVTPTTICGEKNRSELGVESETPEMTGSIPLCIMVHGMGGSDAWSLLFSRSFAVFFPSCFVLCFYWLCFLMYLLHFFNRESMVVIRQSTASKDADWQTWVEILSQRFPDWVLWPLQKLRAASSFMGRDLRELSKMAAAEIFEVVRGTQASSPGTVDRWMGKTCSSVMRVSFTTCFIGQNYNELYIYRI
jgi:hypothetical protein